MPEFQKNYRISRAEALGAHMVRLGIEAPEIAAVVQPGQFVMAACGPGRDPLLRRPFSVHRVDPDGVISLLFRVVGRGTALLAGARPGDEISLVGPLGRGFGAAPETGEVCLVGGGMGCAPLFFLAQRLRALGRRPQVLLGAANAEALQPLMHDFHDLGCMARPSTDDGSLGHHGLIVDLLPDLGPETRKVCCCGPRPMMAAVARFCADHGLECEVSLESVMACGLGACLGCAIPAPDRPGAYRHVCKDGPVFRAGEVQW